MVKHPVRVNQDLCKKCGLCEEFCLGKVFGPKGEIINSDACLGCKKCGQCQLLCPDGAIYFPEGIKLLQSASRRRAGSYFENQNCKGISVPPPFLKRGGWKFKTGYFAPDKYLVSGNDACVMAAINASLGTGDEETKRILLFYAGYPITPASEIMHGAAREFIRQPNCEFIQMEDEIGSIAAVIGASKGGAKALTATSGPGFSLMQEMIGYAIMTETPCVIINVQRAGPSTGQATRTADGDLMQAIWGCHGDARKPVLIATDAQDCYDLTIKAFNLSEEYRTPVILLTNETIAHTEEPIIIPRELRVFDRTTPSFGDGQRLAVTGSTHYLSGLRADSDPQAQQDLMNHFKEKMKNISRRPIVDIKCGPENEVVVVSCGFTARSVAQAIHDLNLGNQVGTIVVKMIWPFPYDEIEAAIPHQANVLVPEMNCGQLFHLVREIHDRRKVFLLDQTNGMPIEPETIEREIKSCLEKVQQ